MQALYDQIQEAISFIRERVRSEPGIGIIMGTGLGNLADDIQKELVIPYKDIPHFPVSTVSSHKGELIFGTLAGKQVVAMAGRFHYYEGYSMKEVTFPIRVMKALGVNHLLISNAAGGTNALINAGDLVLIKDHINMQPENPLRGYNDERLGPRFPDMMEAYDKVLAAKTRKIAKEEGINLHEGIYYCLQGPNFETPAEYEMIHRLGADVVGMSTVPEVIVARHAGIKVLAISVVSNKCYPVETIQYTTLESVLGVVKQAGPKLQLLIRRLVQEIDK